jgi:aspartate aminotransferase
MKLSDRMGRVAPSMTLALNQKAAEMQAAGVDVVSLTAGEPDFGTSPHVIEAIKQALDRGETRYTAVGGINELKDAIRIQQAERGVEYDRSEVVASTGAKQSIYNALMALLNPGDEAITFAPYWLSYPDMIRLADGTARIVETNESEGFVPQAEALEAAITPKTRVVILNSPSNPSGAVYPRKNLEALAQVFRRHEQVIILSDEIYDCFVYDEEAFTSILQVAPDLKNRTLLINGCSKTYAMTGLRLGWALGPKALISAMTTLQGQSTSNASAPIQYGGIAALVGDQSPVRMMLEAFTERRAYVVERLNAMPGVSCYPPMGAFYAFPNVAACIGRRTKNGGAIESGTDVATHLLETQKLMVVPGAPFGAPNHVRISYATSQEALTAGLDRMDLALSELR